MAKVIGYARCSTSDVQQSIDRQIRELSNAGAEKIFCEYEHGTAEHKRQQEAMFDTLAEGDTLIITELSRLTRSTLQLCELIEKVKAKRIKLQILDSLTIDCRSGNIDPMTQAYLQMAGVFAELERKMISERVKSGVQNALAKGKKVGRPETTADTLPESFKKYLPLYTAHKINKLEFSKLAELSRNSVDKYLALAGVERVKRLEGKQ